MANKQDVPFLTVSVLAVIKTDGFHEVVQRARRTGYGETGDLFAIGHLPSGDVIVRRDRVGTTVIVGHDDSIRPFDGIISPITGEPIY